MHPPLKVGIVGAGGFGAFVADAAATLGAEISVTAVADSDGGRAAALAHRSGARQAPDIEALLADDTVDGVIVATPPGTHAAITTAALAAGKHVFCEKPTALSTADAEAIRHTVDACGLTYVVDHVLRYNPVLAALVRLREQRLLGAVQRFNFDNDAADESLPADHWFWDSEVSGGIFLEHGVHFFDAAAMLLDQPPMRVHALGASRPDGILDTVTCTAEHADGALASYGHGFTHAHRAERQLMRLDHGLGEVRVHGWIPLRAEIEVWTDRAEEYAALPDRTAELLAVPGYRLSGGEDVQVAIAMDAAPSSVRARGVEHQAPHRVRASIDVGWPEAKQSVYRESVRAALHDFAECARTGRRPRAGIAEGSAAVAVAAAATDSLHDGRIHPIASG